MQGRCSVSAHLWAPSILILFPMSLGIPENAGVMSRFAHLWAPPILIISLMSLGIPENAGVMYCLAHLWAPPILILFPCLWGSLRMQE